MPKNKIATEMEVTITEAAAGEALAQMFPGRAFLLLIAPREAAQQVHLISNCQSPQEIARLVKMLIDALKQARTPAPLKIEIGPEAG